MTMKLNNEERQMILREWGLSDLPIEEQIVKIFKKVRDIPFGNCGSREPLHVYERNKGTCSGKNFLLRELFRAVGVETRDMICLQRWKDLTWFPDDIYGTVRFPEDLHRFLHEEEIIDFHNYVLIKTGEHWVRVDATIDLPLTELGFYTTEDWDGKSDMPLCFVGSDKIWNCGDDGSDKKAELTAKLPERVQDARSDFLKRITSWIDEWRAR